jgi:glycosyltransferase involved in cell wall biosynthesis
VLSVLLPAYNQPNGVARILGRLEPLKGCPEVEILVSDDSSDDVAAGRILAACEAFGGVRHVRNRPGLGAVQNWNCLLRRARGEFCWLLHHDEEPAPALDLQGLLRSLADPSAADAWLLNCHVVHSAGERPRLHFPARWAVALVRRWPGYLLRRNLIGSPSNLIVRRLCYAPYDERLQWRVDVEAYLRMLEPPVRLNAWRQGGVLSHRDRTNSITASLAANLHAVEVREHDLLRADHGDRLGVDLWLRPGGLASMGRALEAIGWMAFRSVYRALQRLRDVWS